MAYEHLTQRAGWYTAAPGNWGVQDGVPYYKQPETLSEFADEFRCSEFVVSNYQEVLDCRGLVIEPDIATLCDVDVSFLDAETILAILSKCCDVRCFKTELLYAAAASALVDRCLFRLQDIDLMMAPPRGWYERERHRNREVYGREGSPRDWDEDHLPEWVWCLVGNVVDEHPYGTDHKIVHGTKHFSPGTKVYCLPVQWGDGYDQIVVLGKRRGRKGLIRIVMSSSLIENFRCQKVYSPYVIRRMYQKKGGQSFTPWGNSEDEHQEILSMLQWLNRPEDVSDRLACLYGSSRITLSSRVAEHTEGDATLRIERVKRSDGCIGGAWLGYYSIGGGAEQSVGTLETYGYWPEGVPYETAKDIYSEDKCLIGGLSDAGVHLWDEEYAAPSEETRVSYEWSLEIVGESRTLRSRGTNACPTNLPSVYRVLHEWGFPEVWSSEDGAPTAQLA